MVRVDNKNQLKRRIVGKLELKMRSSSAYLAYRLPCSLVCMCVLKVYSLAAVVGNLNVQYLKAVLVDQLRMRLVSMFGVAINSSYSD